MSEQAGGGPDIVVRRCDVTVVRGGGWSWGPAPRDLVRRVVEALPALVTAQLERDGALAAAMATTVDGDVEVTEPVRVVVSLSLADLVAGRVPLPTVAPPAVPVPDVPAAPAPPAAPVPLADPVTPAAAAPAEPPLVPGLGGLAPLLAALAERGHLGHLLDSLPPATRVALAAATATAPAGPDQTSATSRSAPGPAPRMGEAEVASVLPFLVAAALHKIDLLAPIGPLIGDSATFAAGLAYKVLSPLRRGWRRPTADLEAAAAFAGVDGAVPDDALTSLGRRAAEALPVLDSLVGLAVCGGHSADRPLLVVPAGGGLLLVEPEGLFPVAWEDGGAAVVPFWEASGRPLVVAAGDVSVDELVAAGVPLVTGTPPARAGDPASGGGTWRRLPGAGRRWIAGPADAWAGGRLAPRAAAADLTGPAGAAEELMAAMAARPAVPRATHPGLERTLTLLATAGLGTIAWLLWRDREPTDPLLALTRLGDLGGLVRFGADEVRVRLPYGRRHDDLAAHGLLADVPDVSWLDGRALTFGRG